MAVSSPPHNGLRDTSSPRRCKSTRTQRVSARVRRVLRSLWDENGSGGGGNDGESNRTIYFVALALYATGAFFPGGALPWTLWWVELVVSSSELPTHGERDPPASLPRDRGFCSGSASRWQLCECSHRLSVARQAGRAGGRVGL